MYFLFQGLPTGTELIEYLYRTAEILTASPYYKIMLALIRAAFAPYVKLVIDKRYIKHFLCSTVRTQFRYSAKAALKFSR